MGNLFKVLLISSALTLTTLAGARADNTSNSVGGLISYPLELRKDCRGGRAKIYDECSDQMALFEEALARANKEKKVLLVSFGADWCIWCHVFEAYVRGEKDKFEYTFGSPEDTEARDTAVLHERADHDVMSEANELKKFVEDNFVLVHIDAQYAPNGADVVFRAKADAAYDKWLPFVFAVSNDGSFVARFDRAGVENRRDGEDSYRGYHRPEMLRRLTAMRDAALKANQP